jgi:hypothetical protein
MSIIEHRRYDRRNRLLARRWRVQCDACAVQAPRDAFQVLACAAPPGWRYHRPQRQLHRHLCPDCAAGAIP